MGSEELDLKALYGPLGSGEHFIGNTITFTIANRQTMTGTIIYTRANSEYVVQVEGEADHRMVSPCDVVERKYKVGEN